MGSDRLHELYRVYVLDSWDRAYHRASAQSRFNVDLMQVLLTIAADLRSLRLEKIGGPMIGEGAEEQEGR